MAHGEFWPQPKWGTLFLMRSVWWALAGGAVLGVMACGSRTKKKSDPPAAELPSEVPREWSGADDWSGSPWRVEEE